MPTKYAAISAIELPSFIVVVLLIVTTSGCISNLDRALRAQLPQQPVQQQPKVQREVVPPDDPVVQSFSDNVTRLIKQRDYPKLEELGTALTKSKERFKGGGWKIFSFDLLVAAPASDQPIDDAAWQSHIAFL